jgi:hypothetical protein
MNVIKEEMVEGPKALKNFERGMKKLFRAPKLGYKPKPRKAKNDKG